MSQDQESKFAVVDIREIPDDQLEDLFGGAATGVSPNLKIGP
jgi:hypothetical protein